MTHNEKRSTWIREGMIGLGTGIVFGVTVVAVAHVSQRVFLRLAKFVSLKFFFFFSADIIRL